MTATAANKAPFENKNWPNSEYFAKTDEQYFLNDIWSLKLVVLRDVRFICNHDLVLIDTEDGVERTTSS